ncbi:unnamed protein product [Choristocarpus tenellus]
MKGSHYVEDIEKTRSITMASKALTLIGGLLVNVLVRGQEEIRTGFYCSHNGASSSLQVEFLHINPVIEYPGAPISLVISGKAPRLSLGTSYEVDVSNLGTNVDTGDLNQRSTLKFDLCDDFVGVDCSHGTGDSFEGTATWNAFSVSVNEPTNWRVHITNPEHKEGVLCLGGATRAAEESLMGLAEPTAVPAIETSLVNTVNSMPGVSWTAAMSPRFEGYSVADARRIAGGTIMRGHPYFEELPQRKYPKSSIKGSTVVKEGLVSDQRRLRGSSRSSLTSGVVDAAKVFTNRDDDIPAHFDAREAYPQCAEVIGRVRDQSDCGSCWAFGSTEAFNDRRCIKGIKENREETDYLSMLSAEDTTACCHGLFCGLSMGCNGGQPGAAWKWFTKTGVVSGGDFKDEGAGTTCKVQVLRQLGWKNLGLFIYFMKRVLSKYCVCC